MKSMHMLTAERRQKQQIETVQDSASSLWVSCDCPHTHPVGGKACCSQGAYPWGSWEVEPSQTWHSICTRWGCQLMVLTEAEDWQWSRALTGAGIARACTHIHVQHPLWLLLLQQCFPFASAWREASTHWEGMKPTWTLSSVPLFQQPGTWPYPQ